MPLIDLTPEMLGPERDPWPLAYLEAVMLWPDKPDHRARGLQTAHAAYLIDSTKRYVHAEKLMALAFEPGNALEMLTLLANAPPISDIQEATKVPFTRGFVSGFIFVEALHAKKTGRHRNLQQIKRDLIARFKDQPNFRKLSISTVENLIWAKYGPVAHLWGAYLIGGGQGTAFPCSVAGLPRFLAISEGLRLDGEQCRTGHGKTLLDPGKTWTVPASLNVTPEPLSWGQ